MVRVLDTGCNSLPACGAVGRQFEVGPYSIRNVMNFGNLSISQHLNLSTSQHLNLSISQRLTFKKIKQQLHSASLNLETNYFFLGQKVKCQLKAKLLKSSISMSKIINFHLIDLSFD